MNLFENLMILNEYDKRAEEIVDYEALHDYGIDFYERGDGTLVVTTTDFDPIDVTIEETNGKWFVNLPSEDINTVDTDLTSAIIKAIKQINTAPPQTTRGRRSNLKKTESVEKDIDTLIDLAGGLNYIDKLFHEVINEYKDIENDINEVADFTYDRIKGDISLDEWTSVLEYLYYNNGKNINEATNNDLDDGELKESKKIVNEKIKEQDFKNSTNAIKLFTEVFGDSVSFKDVCECLDNEILFTLYKYLIDKYGFYGDGKNEEESDNDLIDSTMYEESNEIEEATSGIGGAYTTKAIDILPTGVKKVKESLYDEYLERIMDEKSNVELVNILHEIRDNKELKAEDRKKLEDEIRTKVRTIKTEAITEFYGKEWSDEEIQKMIDTVKENPGLEFIADPNEVAHPLSYNGKDYWLIGEEKEITFDGKQCVVVFTVDENLKKYLTYFECSYYDDGDGESGPQQLKIDIADVPYKIVEL